MHKQGNETIVTDVSASTADGTIITDVPSDEERVAQNPRMAAMAQIRVDRDEVDAEGFSDKPAEVVADVPAAREDAGKADPGNGVLVAAPDAMVEVMVHGVAKLVPVSEVAKGYQMESVARENLRKASETLKEAEQIKRQAAAPVVAAAPAVSVEAVKAALDLMVEGETGDAAKQLAEMLTAPVATQPLDVQGEVKKALAVEANNKVFDKFLGDYKELADPDVYEICDKIFMRDFKPLIEAGEITYEEALRKSGDATRIKFNITSDTPAADAAKEVKEVPATGRAAVVAGNKARINNIPTAGGRLPAASADKPKSTADVIAEMRSRRGLS